MSLQNITPQETENVLTLAENGDVEVLMRELERLARRELTTVAVLLGYLKNEQQVGPLHKVAQRGHLAVLDYMFGDENGIFLHQSGLKRVIINARSAAGTPLSIAVKSRHTTLVQRLLNLGANVLIPESLGGWVPLHHAAELDQLYSTLNLLNVDRTGPHVNARTQSQETPLLIACRNSHNNIATFLLRRGHPVIDKGAQDATGESAMHHAARNHNLDLVRKLGHFQVPVSLVNYHNNTPYDLAYAGLLVWRDIAARVSDEFRDIIDEIDGFQLEQEMMG